MSVVKIIYTLVVSTALALLLVWQARQVRRDGHRLERLRREAARREAEIDRLRAHIDRLKKPDRISRLVNSLGLELAPPPAPAAPPGGQTVRTVENDPQQTPP